MLFYYRYFTSVGRLTALKANHLIQEQQLDVTEVITQQEPTTSFDCSDCFNFKSVTEREVESVIRGLSCNKAPGYDKIPARILKDSLRATCTIITRLINSSFELSVFPKAWKTAEVIPIPKDRNSDEPSCNRPISLIPTLCKVCERLAHKQFVDLLTENNKLSTHQNGNRKLHSTETALIYVTDELLKAVDEKSISILVLLDMSKAFDSLNHNILLSKLRRLGLASHCLSWFSSYLSDRTQRVRYGDAVSHMLTLTHGVPHGSILGPVLFTTYIDGLINLVTHSQVSCYVDDSQLYLKFQVSNVHNAVPTVNADLQEICKWCARNSLLLNPDKTKLMVVGLPQLTKQLPPISVSIFDKTISPVPFARDLGVYLDQRLSYDTHITNTVSGCFNQLVHINRIKHVLDRPTLLLLTKRFVFTQLFYCSSVWANTSKANIHKLQLVQNFAARIILGLKKFDHISEGLKSLGILKVKDRLDVHDAVMVFKCLNNLAPKYLCDQLQMRSSVCTRVTRSANNLNIPRCRLATEQRRFAYRGVKIWNGLSNDLRNLTSLNAFKRNLVRQY